MSESYSQKARDYSDEVIFSEERWKIRKKKVRDETKYTRKSLEFPFKEEPQPPIYTSTKLSGDVHTTSLPASGIHIAKGKTCL